MNITFYLGLEYKYNRNQERQMKEGSVREPDVCDVVICPVIYRDTNQNEDTLINECLCTMHSIQFLF